MTNRGELEQTIAVVGAGLVGCLAAAAFKKKGYNVTLFELRDDPSKEAKRENLRSINLAVSDRGIDAMKYVDEKLADEVMKKTIPMKGRMIHDASGLKQESQVYGLFGEHINSIDRSYLNDVLLEHLENIGVEVLFKHKFLGVHFKHNGKPILTFRDLATQNENHLQKEYDFVVGSDGAYSRFRYQLQKTMKMNVAQEYIDMNYLELRIPAGPQGQFMIDPNHLHIWPRHKFMLIALANKDGSFTSTFFAPSAVFALLKAPQDFSSFVQKHFPDAYQLIGKKDLEQSFDANPVCSLMQVRSYPYHNPQGNCVIIGDAAHLMVPFYGQGMNCGFEDVRVLMELIDANGGDIYKATKAYSDARKDDLDAICKLALDNYHEMSSKVTSVGYLFKKRIDYFLGKYCNGRFFQWLPLYTMISFRADVPYSRAIQIAKRQDRILNLIQLSSVSAVVIFAAAKWSHAIHKLTLK